MPTIFSHVAVPLALRLGLGKQVVSTRLLIAGLIGSALPDADVLAFRLGIAYADAFGHRGASHSLAFALIVGLAGALMARSLHSSRAWAFGYLGLSTASHGLLDMLTNGGHGVALWWPVSSERLFFPWQVVEVSPLSIQRVFGPRGLEVFSSELVWICLPCILLAGALVVARRFFTRAAHA